MAASFMARTFLLMTTALAAPAMAQTTDRASPPSPRSTDATAVTSQDATAEAATVPQDSAGADIVVTGARLQAIKDIAAKRSIGVISDSISSDEIGTLPDFGLGEALTRVPGISTVQNNGRGEAQFLSIRGLNADYNLVEIDGVPLPANEISRRNVSLDVIPSSLAARVEVYKSMDAAMNGNAIGGIANLRTRSAFDNGAKPFLGGRFDIGRWDFQRTRGGNTPSGQAELVGATTFGPDHKFGLVVAGSYFRRVSASLNSASTTPLYVDPTTGQRLNAAVSDAGNAAVVPSVRRWLHYDNLRQRYGGFAKLEFDDHVLFKGALTFAKFYHTNDEDRQANSVTPNTTVTAATGRFANIVNVTTAGGSVTNGNYAQADASQFFQKRGIQYGDFHGELDPGSHIKADFGVNYAIATYSQDATTAVFRIPGGTNLAYRYTITPGRFPQFDFANPGYVFGAANYSIYDYQTVPDDQKEKALTGRANLRVNTDSADRGFGFATGLFARFVDRRYDRAVNDYTPVAGATSLAPFVVPQRYTPYNGNGQTMIFFDPDAVSAFFAANRGKFTANPTNVQTGLQSDYTLTEDIKAAYLLGRYALDTLRLTGGVRYEATDLTTGSYAITTAGRATTLTYGQQGQHYHDWLPSAQLDWDVTGRLRARAAFGRTLARPNYSDLAGRQTIAINSGTNFVTITTGNAQLRPRRSDNYDVSLEYYVNRDVLFAAAGFIKTIRDEILTVSNTALQPYNGVTTQVTTIRPVNASGTVIRRVELNAVVTRMSFLPRPLDGLGLSANLTLLNPTAPSVMMANGTRRQLASLVESADVVGNVRVFYTVGPVTVQGAWNHLSPLLLTVSTTDPTQDVRYKASDLFDAQVRVKLSRALTIVAQGKNLSDNLPTRVTGPAFNLLSEELANGRAYYIGALVRF
ncbi:TonB-dependent receptor [Sphingomonas sp. A2-49]|uniref:TonB-dependent receptor n=1 Tax=Sphingomonas sp. A2-49 TaxID=1391375 RepID=UPI0021D3AC3C|nr:TonB-dependent receptor [Sphingomonas sp. A2-49]MCU6455553.1 TonB-dependent receptor [Sphingomonas sp. A2-49]